MEKFKGMARPAPRKKSTSTIVLLGIGEVSKGFVITLASCLVAIIATFTYRGTDTARIDWSV